MTTAAAATGRIMSAWWLLPALALMLSGTIASNQPASHPRVLAATVLAGAATLALTLSRRRPLTAAFVCSVLVAAYFALGFADGPIFLILPATAFLLAVQLPTRRWVAAVSTALVVVAAGLAARGAWFGHGAAEGLQQAIGLTVVTGAAAAVAVTVRSRRQTAAERAQRAATEEQLRMARDLHDGVGHGLAVIAMQSGVALHLLDKDVVDRDAARRALQAIRDTSRESLQSLRVELSRLTPSAPAPTAPRRGLADLPVLIERLRAGGLTVDLRDGHGSVPDAVDETAYVIVQESLTNVLRHASARQAVVELRDGDGVLHVNVADDGGGGGSVVEGFGITGMRSRVRRLGGTLQVGPTSEGFEVRAELPLGEPA